MNILIYISILIQGFIDLYSSSSCDKSDTVSILVIVMYLKLEAINYYFINFYLHQNIAILRTSSCNACFLLVHLYLYLFVFSSSSYLYFCILSLLEYWLYASIQWGHPAIMDSAIRTAEDEQSLSCHLSSNTE